MPGVEGVVQLLYDAAELLKLGAHRRLSGERAEHGDLVLRAPA